MEHASNWKVESIADGLDFSVSKRLSVPVTRGAASDSDSASQGDKAPDAPPKTAALASCSTEEAHNQLTSGESCDARFAALEQAVCSMAVRHDKLAQQIATQHEEMARKQEDMVRQMVARHEEMAKMIGKLQKTMEGAVGLSGDRMTDLPIAFF